MRRINGYQAHCHCDQHIHLLLLFGSEGFTISENLIIYLARVRLKTPDQPKNDCSLLGLLPFVSGDLLFS